MKDCSASRAASRVCLHSIPVSGPLDGSVRNRAFSGTSKVSVSTRVRVSASQADDADPI